MPTASVLDVSVRRNTLAMRNSLMVPMNDSSALTARIGVTSGMMMRKNVCECEAPSIIADWSSSFGSVSRKPFISQVFTPSAPPR
jgi:hypothetical protein